MSVRACVIEKKLQVRLRKVSFADSEKPEIIVKPGQGAPIHREQNLRGLPKAHKRAAPSQCLKSMNLWGGRCGLRAGGGGALKGKPRKGRLVAEASTKPLSGLAAELTTEPSPCHEKMDYRNQ